MLNVGENFLHYKLISRIGAGGMGEVYLAKDRHLERKVAIKILRKKFSQNGDGLRRFILEAKSASALNHPNIITIYEIGESEGSNYIASEYIDGKTLHARLEKNPPSLAEVLRIAIQIAEAITAAHAAGIVHRDIKPENVMIRKDGYIKVLDFGLAKLTEHNQFSADFDADTQTMLETNPGIIMGTVSYMSPEQARARDVDGRSDIWSLGVLIYEMIAGVRPFTGDTTSDVIAAILRSEPAGLSRLVPDIPRELEHIVAKALRKDREERYQHVKDMLIDLKDLMRDLDVHAHEGRTLNQLTIDTERPDTTDQLSLLHSATESAAGRATNSISEIVMTQFRLHPKGIIAGTLAVFLVIAAAAIGAKMFVQARRSAEAFQSMRLTKLTTAGNAEGGQIAISPDGKYVVYAVDDDGKQSLWVRHVSTASNVQVVPPADVSFDGITFSNDGGYVFYSAGSRKNGYTVYKVPVLGGDVRKIVSDASGPITFSPGGERFAFIRRDTALLTARADGTDIRSLSEAGTGKMWSLSAWSPDGSVIVTREYSAEDSSQRLIEIAVQDGTQRSLAGSTWLGVNGLAWLPDGSGLLLSGRDNDIQLSQVWLVTYPDGNLARVTNDLNSYQGLSLTGDGKTLVSVQENRSPNIWVGSENGSEQLRRITSDVGKDNGLSGISLTPDGKVVYTTRITGTNDLWIVNSDGSNNRRLTFDVRSNFYPAVSPDGRNIVFVSNRSGRENLWQMETDGGNPVQLTETEGIEGFPAYSPDGKWLVYQITGGDNVTTIWKMPAGGGDSVQLTTVESERPAVSPDGKYIACRLREGAANTPNKIAIIPFGGGPPVQLLDFASVVLSPVFRWSSDGRALIYVDKSGKDYGVKFQFLDGSPATFLSEPMDERIYLFDVSRDGKSVAVARGTKTNDAVMITNFR